MGNQAKAKVVLVADDERRDHLAPLAAELRESRALEVEESTELDRLLDLRGVRAVYADWSAGPLSGAQAQSLTEFVESGGCVVAVGRTLAAWAAQPAVGELAGWTPDGLTVSTELVVSPADAGQPAFRIRDRVHMLATPPPQAEALLLTSWQYTSQVVAYERTAGAGRFVYVGLGDEPSAYSTAGFRQVVGRTLHRAVDRVTPAVHGVGLLGFGALGALHAGAISGVTGLELRAVCDNAAARRDAAAALDVAVYADADGLLADSN
ncbi:MAG TPA: ThuA domain-containing protein, partial [Candidatus Dormibacteraeota bacterium]|nr:ThuA domain-containing protein [Candidatus Dormibacteraeota bacterium]